MPNNPHIFTVRDLVASARHLLEQTFPDIWVEGEISNLATPPSGHLYFSLKDERATVRCALFRNRQNLTTPKLKNGQRVVVRGRISLFEARGDFQLIATQVENAGEGRLKEAFEALKHKLSAEGLFSEANKQPLPLLPNKVGVITSPTGAALQDILTTLNRRMPSIEVVIYPTRVQGVEATAEIVNMVQLANRHNSCDLLIVARGGGSLEDLQPFNEESVARALFASLIPVISGVGHETDFTITDLVADHRAPTPTAAAEQISPEREELLARLTDTRHRLQRLISHHLEQLILRVDSVKRRLIHPQQRLTMLHHQCDHLVARLNHGVVGKIHLHRLAHSRLKEKLSHSHPKRAIENTHILNQQLRHRLIKATSGGLLYRRRDLGGVVTRLQDISPLATLKRGYSITRLASDGSLVRGGAEVKPGVELTTRFAQCEVASTVKNIKQLTDSD